MTPPIPFETFMARALHQPKTGYYARQIATIGQRGDFTTAPLLSDRLARAIARWASQALRETGCRDLIEIGPGTGALAAAVWQNLPWHLRLRTRLHLVETSAPLLQQQQKLLGNRATWHPDMSTALRATTGRAVIFSNEWVDAFPVRRFQSTHVGWQEMAVSFDNENTAHESLLPPAPLPDSSAFQGSYPQGQIVEIHQSYQRYLATWLPQWQAGRMLTIDYGEPIESLYLRRPRGTLRAYWQQQRFEGLAIYYHPGRQDLTADVNFTDLQAWSAKWVGEQRLLLLREFLETVKATAQIHDAMLQEPGGAGNSFRVLIQNAAPQTKP
jgi:SAM-dependent MidA family methyltransferase